MVLLASISPPRSLILFDLDNTLFDHHHSLASAITAIQETHQEFSTFHLQDFELKYNTAIQGAYDKYLSKEITYQATEALKIQLFYDSLPLKSPDTDTIQHFRSIYNA